MRRAFTLIELLIVVAIISILAAIAIPNYLDAQVRSRVSAAKANMRTVATKIEMYQVDWGKYPAGFSMFFAYPKIPSGSLGFPSYPLTYGDLVVGDLYLEGSEGSSSQNLDPFHKLAKTAQSTSSMGHLVYMNHRFMVDLMHQPGSYWDYRDPCNWTIGQEMAGEWSLHSIGPVQREYYICKIKGPDFEVEACEAPSAEGEHEKKFFWEYDPTNGTISDGYVWRTQKNAGGFGIHHHYYTPGTHCGEPY